MVYTHVAAFVVALAVGLFGGWQARDWKAGADDADRLEVALEAQRMAATAERRKFIAAKGAYDALTKRLDRARGDAAGSRAELDRLLNQPAPAPITPDDPGSARSAVARAVPWDVFRDCATALQALGAEADSLEARLIGWQQWWQSVKP